jgi:hypothetical protein
MKSIAGTMLKCATLLSLTVVLSTASPLLPQAASNYVYLSCEKSYKTWLKKKEHWMAFAQNETRNQGSVCGWGKGWATRRQAINAAMRQCRLAEKENPTWGKKGTCRIISVK